MRVAAVQLTSTPDKRRNLEAARRLAAAAAGDGARLVVLPETFNCMGDEDTLRHGAEFLGGPTLAWARGLSRELGVWLVAGSIYERVEGADKLANTSCLIGPDGEVRAVYRKVHLFDCDVPGAALCESRLLAPGRQAVVADAGGLPLGLTICYDLRFPELFRVLALNGARAVALPAAFTERTGRDHWEVLLRARAIENQVYLIAAAQVGQAGPGPHRFGRSMVIDPWGTVLAQAPDRETFISAELDAEAQDAVRRQLPCLRHRRPEAYRWPAGDGAGGGVP